MAELEQQKAPARPSFNANPVNKKKCPKCGEENPAEAVMCWACYTPLSGSSAASPAGAAPGGRSAPAATANADEKPKIPPWQLAVIGIGVLLAAGLGVRTLMPADSEDTEDDSTPPAAATANDPQPGAPPPAPEAVVSAAPQGGGAVVVTPTEAPFTIVVPPNPKLSVATMAIVPTDNTTSGPMAASYAAYVRRQYSAQAKNWSTLYIYVFSDAQSAQYFANLMKRRRGAALTESDMSSLSTLWSSTLARYEYSTERGKRVERVQYPSKNPSGWWYRNQG